MRSANPAHSTSARDARLAFGWHAVETSLVALLALTAFVGLIWSWRHLPGHQTATEISQELANRRYNDVR